MAIPPLTSVFKGVPPQTVVSSICATDTHFEYPGPRVITKNPIFDYLLPVSHRPLINTITAPLYMDEAFRVAKHYLRGTFVRGIQFLGDAGDTPGVQEIRYAEAVFERQDLPILNFDRGNHSSFQAFGVGNLLSSAYDLFFGKFIPLQAEIEDAVGGADNILTAQKTFQAMHRILHRGDKAPKPIETLSTPVLSADGDHYLLGKSLPPVIFNDENTDKNFDTFWKKTTLQDTSSGKRDILWECLINYHLADTHVPKRDSSVPSMYLQAREHIRFKTEEGHDIPIYELTMDSMDTNQLASWTSNISDFQIHIIENFIDKALKTNPNSRFKISIHCPITDLPRRTRNKLKILLKREEIILVKAGHVHYRSVLDLNVELQLNRKTKLPEIIIPSLTDYRPYHNLINPEPLNARALGLEKLTLNKTDAGKYEVLIDFEFFGLDEAIMAPHGYSPRVSNELQEFQSNHGYMYTKEIIKELFNKMPKVLDWHLENITKRVKRFFTHGLNPRSDTSFEQYWKEDSFIKNIFDTFAAISTVQMFHEAKGLIPFLQSAHNLISDDDTPDQVSIKAQLGGIISTLQYQHDERREKFETELNNGTPFSELRKINNLFVIGGVEFLPELLLKLREDSEARAFCVIGGLQAAHAEYKYHIKLPTLVPNRAPTFSFPIEPRQDFEPKFLSRPNS